MHQHNKIPQSTKGDISQERECPHSQKAAQEATKPKRIALLAKEFLYSEFVAGKTLFDRLFISLGIALQVVVFILHPERPILIISGITGIFSVILCSQGKISSFFFGFIQVITYAIICFEEHLYGEVAINIFYFLTMIYGLFSWLKHYGKTDDSSENKLHTRHLKPIYTILLSLFTIAASVGTALFLKYYSDDSQPWLDAFTTIPAFVGQLLMITRYREQWGLWLIVDILSIAMWFNAANYSMTALYIFWCLNCLYGYYNWRKLSADT